MNHPGKKIRALRNQKGISQETLAEKAQLSLRTIQRIETGETEPRGDTFNRLAAALEVDIEELIDEPAERPRSFLALLNLSGLCFLIIPVLGILVPLIVWILQRDKLEQADETGKKILNFQITWSILRFMIIGVIFKVSAVQLTSPAMLISSPAHFNSGMLALFAAYGFNAFLIIYNTLRSLNDKAVVYQPAFRLIK